MRWWRRRTLHARLSLLVTGAVGIAVLVVGTLAFAAVAEIQRHQLQSQLATDAAAIAAAPDQWRNSATQSGPPAGHSDIDGDGDHGPHDLGARWQVLDGNGDVVSQSTSS